MVIKVKETNNKKSKIRFNFADALILLLLFFLLSWGATEIAFGTSPVTLSAGTSEIEFQLTEDARTLCVRSKQELSEGQEVYDAESGVLIGTLASDYTGKETMTVLLVKEFETAYLPDDQLDLRIDNLLFADSTVNAVRKEGAQ